MEHKIDLAIGGQALIEGVLIRAPSFINLTLLKEMLVGWKMADMITIVGSIDFNMGEVDR